MRSLLSVTKEVVMVMMMVVMRLGHMLVLENLTVVATAQEHIGCLEDNLDHNRVFHTHLLN